MKNAFYFLLGLCLVVLTSATTVSVMTVKPATPKLVFVDYEQYTCNVVSLIKHKTKEGFVLKACTCYTTSNGPTYLLVMEKY